MLSLFPGLYVFLVRAHGGKKGAEGFMDPRRVRLGVVNSVHLVRGVLN